MGNTNQTDCQIRAISMILEYYNLANLDNLIKENLKIHSYGSSPMEVALCLEKMGVKTKLYLNGNKFSKNESSIIEEYKTTSEVEEKQLTSDDLEKLNYPSIFNVDYNKLHSSKNKKPEPHYAVVNKDDEIFTIYDNSTNSPILSGIDFLANLAKDINSKNNDGCIIETLGKK